MLSICLMIFVLLNLQYNPVRVEAKLKPFQWKTSPEKAISDCVSDSGLVTVTEYFDQNFTNFASDLFKVLGSVFPYEIHSDTLTQVSAGFVHKYSELEKLFIEYRNEYKEANFARNCNGAIVSIENNIRIFIIRIINSYIFLLGLDEEKVGEQVLLSSPMPAFARTLAVSPTRAPLEHRSKAK